MVQRALIGISVLLIVFHTKSSLAEFGLFNRRDVQTVSTTDLLALLKNQRRAEVAARRVGDEIPRADFVLVDVRSSAEAGVSMIPGAVTKAYYERNRQKFQGCAVIAYCTIGVRSETYARHLVENGVTARNYKGSILKWASANLPLMTPEGAPTNRIHTYSDRYHAPDGYVQVTD